MTYTRRQALWASVAGVASLATTPAFATDATSGASQKASHPSSVSPKGSTERPIRRKDYELSEKEAWYVVENTQTAVMATCDLSGVPYATPITPLVLNGKIYIHGTKDPKSRKYLNLEQNPRVSLAWVGQDPLKEDEFTVKYVSAIVAGTAKRIEDPKAMWAIFEAYTARFAGSQEKLKQHSTIKGSINDVALWEITVEKITGKAKTKTPFFDNFKG